MNPTNRTVITLPSEREILITREFDAPRELVFKAHTDPALIPLWYGPRDTTTRVEEMDVRPGGLYRFIHHAPDGSEFCFYGEFREIVPHERIVQTSEFDQAPGQVVIETLTFEERDGKTLMTVLEVCPSVEARDAIMASGMEEGLSESYDRLAEILAEQSAAAR
jgi:uncharacterized protein YndB with AHSA1/START domain